MERLVIYWVCKGLISVTVYMDARGRGVKRRRMDVTVNHRAGFHAAIAGGARASLGRERTQTREKV